MGISPWYVVLRYAKLVNPRKKTMSIAVLTVTVFALSPLLISYVFMIPVAVVLGLIGYFIFSSFSQICKRVQGIGFGICLPVLSGMISFLIVRYAPTNEWTQYFVLGSISLVVLPGYLMYGWSCQWNKQFGEHDGELK